MGFFFLAVIALIYTRSRGGYIVFAVVGSLLFFRVMLPRTKNKVLPIILICALGAVGFYEFRARITERVESITKWKTDASAQKRILSIVTALNMMKENPWFGIGIGAMSSFKNVFVGYCPDQVKIPTGFGDNDYIIIGKVSEEYEIHNAYMSLGGKVGIQCLVFFIMWIIFSVVKMWRLRKKIRSDPQLAWAYNVSFALEFGVIAYAINAMLINSLADGFIYILFAMTSSLYYLVLKPKNRLNPAIALGALYLFGHWLYYTLKLRV